MTVRERGILALLPSPCRKALMQGHGSPSFLVAAASSPALLIRLHEAPYPTFMEYQASRFRSHAYTD